MNRNIPISRYSHLNKLPREKEALLLLKKVAYLVKPIMKARKWKVGTLAEFLPSEQKLLGINMNHGERICIRLRYATDQNNFLPFEQIIDTMLHELCHNVHGPHNAHFHELWDQLRSEYEDLLSRGYTEEGVFFEGKRFSKLISVPGLGAAAKARKDAAAVEQRRTHKRLSSRNPGCRFSFKSVRSLSKIRTVFIDAIQRRVTVLNGCGASSRTDKEIEDLAIQATKNGFASQAEEDEANERAIFMAICELLQEDLANQHRNTHLFPDKDFPSQLYQSTAVDKSSRTKLEKISTLPIRQPPILNVPQVTLKYPSNVNPVLKRASTQDLGSRITPHSIGSGWDCPSCTFHNSVSFLTCGVCFTGRPIKINKSPSDTGTTI